MSETITITATVAVWLPTFTSPVDLVAMLEREDTTRIASSLSYYGAPDRQEFSNYSRIGEADITLRLLPRDEQVRNAVGMLNKRLNEARAEWLQRQQAILAEISKLQALEFSPEAA